MERLTAVETRIVMIERTLAMLVKTSPHADLFLQMLEELAVELAPQELPAECFQLRDALRSHITDSAPGPGSP